jgi:hypothetical protein
MEWASTGMTHKKFYCNSGAGKNIFSKGIDHFSICHTFFIPLAPMPSGIDLRRISKNVSSSDETFLLLTGS